MQPIKKEDLLSYRFLSGVTASPDGNKAVFTVAVQDVRQNGYKKNLYLVDLATEKVEKLTSHGKAGAFLFEDSGTLLCQKPGKEPGTTAFERFSLAEKKAEPAFSIGYPVLGFWKLGAGLYLIKADVDTNLEGLSDEEKKAEEDYIHIGELPFWDNGVGYVSGHRDTLFLYKEKEDTLTQVTGAKFATGAVAVAGGGSKVYFTGAEYSQMREVFSGLYELDPGSGKVTELLPQDKMRLGQLFEAGGVLYVAGSFCDKMGGTEKNDWYILKGKKLVKIADNDFTIGCNISTDCRYGHSAALCDYQGKLMHLSTKGTVCAPVILDKDGNVQPAFAFDGAVDGIAAAGEKVLFTAMKKGKLQELYLFDGKKVKMLTRMNSYALSGKYVGEPEYCGFTNSQGTPIDGWVIKPYGYDPEKKYPALLSMHGGPCVAWGEIFVHEMQMLAGLGYFVFFCNPRGSDGKGAKFADIKNKYGTVDFEDFMEFTDHVLESYPAIDSGKLGVLGGSYGGYMTNWIIGNTHRFAAAVSQRSFCNPISDFGNSCIGYSFDAKEFAATPWTGLDRMWDHAPLKYAPNVTTPTLFIHSLEDYNCPLSQGFEMFSALKYHGVTSEMVLFKGENHELSRSGKPTHRQRRLAEISRWFDTYLMK